jgi:hypothetical protein
VPELLSKTAKFADGGINMEKIIDTWTEEHIGPKLAMVAAAVTIVYLFVAG